jgi:hypothetical protein
MSNPFAVTTVRCSGPNCESVRKEVNHWFVVTVGESFICRPFDAFNLRPIDKPVCGQQCAQRLFEKYLGEGKQ